MDWQAIRWDMALESQPAIVHLGESTHGREREEMFMLPDLWCFHLYTYEAELEVDGQLLPIKPGYVGVTPPGSTALYHFAGRSPHYYVHFSLPSGGPTYKVPAMLDLKTDFAVTVRSFQEAIRMWPVNHQRSMVRLWDILWQLADISASNPPSDLVPEPVQRVLNYVDTHLHEPLNVKRLAEEQGLSHNHFTRLFRTAQGCTPLEYIQRRRVAQAKHLLIYTSLPIKAVAASIAITDMQVFNKFVKHYLGCAPRRLREEELPKLGLME